MTYTPFLIANNATGLDRSRQPWLLPDDAQEVLYDGYVYRGVNSKREGYNGLATGQRITQPYTESRIVNQINNERTGQTNTGIPVSFSTANSPVGRGRVVISDGVETHTDNGLGAFPTAAAGTINYTTGAITGFQFNAASANPITVSYAYYPAEPVMGIMNYINETNEKILLVADTQRVNIYNKSFNILEYAGNTFEITGITNAANGVVTTGTNHNLATGDSVFIYGVGGMTQVNNQTFVITYVTDTTFELNVDTTAYGVFSGNGTGQQIYTGTNKNFWSWVNYQDGDGNPRLIFTNNKDQVQYYAPHLTPAFGDYVHYPNTATPDFQMISDTGVAIYSIKALLIFEYKDRLIMLRTTENNVVKPRRIRVSGTGASSDDFRTDATGAGFIDIPDQTWIMGAAFNRDDLIIFTEAATWILKYTGNDTVPFALDKIDTSRGSQAPFSAITYLNRTTAASTRGLIITDGYRVERSDDKIPAFTYNEVDGDNFDLCFAGSVDVDRDHYLLYPPPGQSGTFISQRILVTNYEEDNYAIYRIPLSCMGTHTQPVNVTWTDLLIYNNWDEFAAVYSNWNQFPYSKGTPISIGGGHKGEVWQLNVAGIEDNPQKIRNITQINSTTLEITTDWNNYSVNSIDQEMGKDIIYFTNVEGMVEINNQQYPITSITNNYTFRVAVPASVTFSPYTGSGTASRVIPFISQMKKFNPYLEGDKKVRCGWLYMYVQSTGTFLDKNLKITGATQANPCVITTLINHNYQTGEQVTIFGVGGMTQLNDLPFTITVLTPTTFSLNGIDSTGYGAYSSGGYVSTSEKAKLEVQVITNDTAHPTQLAPANPYQGSCTNLVFEDGIKKWYKIYINQTGRFIQFRFKNVQAGAKINIEATMPGFQPVGRIL
jgi:hypothetical protein